MNKIIKNVFLYFTSSIEYKIIICYIFIGSFYFGVQYANASYIEMVFYHFSNYIFVPFFIYLPFLIMYNFIYNYINNSISMIIRLKSVKKLLMVHILSMIAMTLFLLMILLLIILITSNLIPNSGFNITYNLGYKFPDICYFILTFVSTFLSLVLAGIINIFIRNIFNKDISLIVLIGLILFIEISSFFSNDTIISIFNPGINTLGIIHRGNIVISLANVISYFSLSYLILLIITFNTNKKYIQSE